MIKEYLSQRLSKSEILDVSQHFNPQELIYLIQHPSLHIAINTARITIHTSKTHFNQLLPIQDQLINLLLKSHNHSLQRNFTPQTNSTSIAPPTPRIDLLNYCLNNISNWSVNTNIRAYSAHLAYRIAKTQSSIAT